MGVNAVLFMIAAGCWPTGIYLLVTGLQQMRRPARRSLGDRLLPFAPTPLADEVERWLSQQS